MLNVDELQSLKGVCNAVHMLYRVLDALGVKRNPEEEIDFLTTERRVIEEFNMARPLGEQLEPSEKLA